MNNIFLFLIITSITIQFYGNQNLSNSKEESLKEFRNIPNKVFVTGKDTISLFYKISPNVVRIKCLKNNKELFIKEIIIDDLISDAPFKDKTYFDNVYFTGFEESTKELVFTTYLKRTDIKKFKIEAVFTLDLNSNFNAIRD